MKLFPKLAITVSALLIGTTACLSLSFYFAERHAIRAQARFGAQKENRSEEIPPGMTWFGPGGTPEELRLP